VNRKYAIFYLYFVLYKDHNKKNKKSNKDITLIEDC